MKKIISFLSLAAILGMNYIGSQGSTSLTASKISSAADNAVKTYVVILKDKPTSKDASKNRQVFLNELAYKIGTDAFDVNYEYDTIYSGFSITFHNAEDASILKTIKNVESSEKIVFYSKPEVVVSNALVDGEEDYREKKLVNYSAETMGATLDVGANAGKGIKIGIIDTGLYLNQVQGTTERANFEAGKYGSSAIAPAFKDLDSSELDEDAITDEYLTAHKFTKVALEDAGKSRKTGTYARVNNKIPFMVDYADGDNDADPEGGADTNEHGTHVASLAAANGTDHGVDDGTGFQGIAPKAQLAIMKVFANAGGGASTDNINAALNDAAKLELDVVNLSLGSAFSDYTATNPVEDSSIYNSISACQKAGVIVNFAAGNDGKASYAGTNGYADWSLDTSETGILGDDAVQDELTNVVAASSPNKAFFSSIMLVNGTAVSYSDQAVNRANMDDDDKLDKEYPLTGLLNGASSGQFEYVRIGGYGDDSDYEAAKAANHDVKGKIAVIDRGSTTFRDKALSAEAAGASALIVINNVPGATFNMNMDFNGHKPTIPVVFTLQSSRNAFCEVNDGGTLTLGQNLVEEAPDGDVYASFTSDGSDVTLDISPTISAPGSLIMGAVYADYTGTETSGTVSWESGLIGYENMSGTSMASPNFTGALALALGEKKASMTAEDFASYKKLASKIAMSTADSVKDTTADKNPASIRIQGAGRVNVDRMLTANSYVDVDGSKAAKDANGLQLNDGLVDSKAELKQIGTGLSSSDAAYIEIPYTIHNDSGIAQTYNPSVTLQIPTLRIQVSQKSYDETTTKDDIPEHLPDAITQSINDDVIEVPDSAYQDDSTKAVTVAAGGTATGTMKVRIDNIPVTKNFLAQSVNVKDFSGTLKEYFNKYFNDSTGEYGNSGGSYVEGFVKFTSTNTTEDNNYDLNIPYMGFYGDFTQGDAVEPFESEKVDGKLYNSEMIDNYRKRNTGVYQRSDAYSGSTISTYGQDVSDDIINEIGDLKTAATKTVNSSFNVAMPNIREPNTIYAGSENTDHIVSVFFVLRTVNRATYTIKDESGNSVKTGYIVPLYNAGSAASPNFIAYSMYGQGRLIKSWLNETLSSSRGFADIDLSEVDEGNYTLSYDFEKAAGGTQTKSYKLVVDKKAPSLTGYSYGTTTVGKTTINKLTMKTDADVGYMGGIGYTAADGSIGLTIRDNTENENSIELQDYAGNTNTVLVHLNDMKFMVASSEFTSSHRFQVTQTRKSGSNYTYSVSILKGDDLATLKKSYDVLMSVGTGLTTDQITASIDNTETTNFEYDETTGILVLHMNSDSTGFTINHAAVALGAAHDSNTNGSDNKGTGEGLSPAIIAAIVGGVAVVAIVLIIVIVKAKKGKGGKKDSLPSSDGDEKPSKKSSKKSAYSDDDDDIVL